MTNEWLENPMDRGCAYPRRKLSTLECSQWVNADCSKQVDAPFSMMNRCGCKVFANKCYYEKFNCNFENGKL